MAKFRIISASDQTTVKYEGTPSYTGTYMKPGVLEFREIASPVPIDWKVGDYVDYTRTGFRYRLYSVPQVKRQARNLSYGGAFVYQGVQLFDASKMLELCPFRDLVKGDNRIHFSTQPSISTFEGCDGLARRFEACLQDQYGDSSWRVRIATQSENPDLYALMTEAREFTVSGANILEALDKIYEIWPEVGWIYTVEGGIDTIIIGGAGLNANEGTYAYGKGSGLTALTRTVANADEFANRIYAYGSSRNMLPRWYNNQIIKDAESVDIQNLMIPVSRWGLTRVDGDDLPDAAKAYVDDAESISRLGLRPKTVYFDGTGDMPEIYPTIREVTIADVLAANPDYVPSSSIYTDPTLRVDQVLSVPTTFDSGLAGDTGKSALASGSGVVNASGVTTFPAGSSSEQYDILTETFTVPSGGDLRLSVDALLEGSYITCNFARSVLLLVITSADLGTPTAYTLEQDNMGRWTLGSTSVGPLAFTASAGATVSVKLAVTVFADADTSDRTFTMGIDGEYSYGVQLYRAKTFKMRIPQIGFDIAAQAALGDGMTISFRSGKCAGRSFTIKGVTYLQATDSWLLEVIRSEDSSLGQWFPNTDYPVESGDEFVLLDIAMPQMYVRIAENRLYQAALDLLADTAVERWQYVPDIDAKYMVENSRTIRAGEYMVFSDADIVGGAPASALVDSVTINEGEAAIPTYKVTLRDRKKKTYSEGTSSTTTASNPVTRLSSVSGSESSTMKSGGDAFWELDSDGNVTLKAQYQNAWVPGWLAAGGIGAQGSGGGGGLIETVSRWTDLQSMSTPPEDGTSAVFNSRAVYEVYQLVKSLQQATPNVSLSNGNAYSTLTVNGTTADFYTKAQVDALIGDVDLSDYGTALSLTSGAAYLKDSNGNYVLDANQNRIVVAGRSSSNLNLLNSSGSVLSSVELDFAPSNIKVLSSVTTEEDMTLDFNWSDGNITKVDLSHRHLDYENAIAALRIWIDDGNGNLTLDTTRYTNVWVPGWLAAGGVGSGSGGGGGVSYLRELTDIYHGSGGVLRSDGTAVQNGDALVYDSANTRWVAAAVSGGGGGGGSTVSVTQLQTAGTAIAIVTVDGTDTTLYAPTSGGVATETDPVYSAWIATSRTKNTVLAAPSSANGAPTFRALAASDIPSLTVSKISDAESWISGKGYALASAIPTKVSDLTNDAGYLVASDLSSINSRLSAIEGWFEVVTVDGVSALHVLNGRALYSDSWVAAGGVGSGSGGGSGTVVVWGTKSGYTRPLVVEGVSETLLLDGALTGYATQSWVQGQGYLTSHQDLSGYVTTSALNTALASYATTTALSGYLPLTGGTLTGALGGTTASFSGDLSTGGKITVNGVDSINQYDAAAAHYNLGGGQTKTFNAYGTGINLRALDGNGQTNILAVNSGVILAGSTVRPNYNTTANLGADSSDGGRWANIYGVNENLSGALTVGGNVYLGASAASSSYLEWDSQNGAWHLVGNFYADGWIASGGLGASGNLSYELSTNKVTSLSSSSTDTQYPSAKCVYDHVDNLVGNVETLLAAI